MVSSFSRREYFAYLQCCLEGFVWALMLSAKGPKQIPPNNIASKLKNSYEEPASNQAVFGCFNSTTFKNVSSHSFPTQRIVALSPILPYFPGDSSSLSSSCKLWISVAVVAPFLLFGFGIATIYVYNRSKKAELYFNKQV